MKFGDRTGLEHSVDLLSRAQQLLPLDFSGGLVLKNSPANAGDTGLILVPEDSICQEVGDWGWPLNWWATTTEAHTL